MASTPTQKPGPSKAERLATRPVVWQPQPGAQTRLITCPCDEILYGGAKGGGKSDAILGMWLKHMGRNPVHARGVIFRKAYPDLEQLMSRAREIFGRMDGGNGQRPVFSKQAKTWYFPSGAVLKFRFVDNVEDAASYQGHEYTFIAFDEVGEIKNEEIVNLLRGALRSSKDITDRVLLLSGNPLGKGHKWLFKRFIDGMQPEVPKTEEMTLPSGIVVRQTRVFIPSLLEDNPALLKKDPGYELRLKQMCKGKPGLYQALRFGDWHAKLEVPGALLTADIIEKHRVGWTPELAKVIIGVDPTVKGYDPDKTEEELEQDGDVGDACGIYALGRDVNSKRYVLKDFTLTADPTIWARRVVKAFYEMKADIVVAEANNGGELVKIAIHQVDPNVPVELVNAKRGKYTRAEPAAMAVRDGELMFVGEHDKLEVEFCTWVPDGKHASPNRIDAIVWAWTYDAVGGGDPTATFL